MLSKNGLDTASTGGGGRTSAGSMRRATFMGILLTGMLALIAGGYALYITGQREAIERELSLHLRAPVEKALLLSALRQNMGYGGFIHHFKNFVIRGEASYWKGALDNHDEALRLVETYRKTDVTAEESIALDTIVSTLWEYRQNLDVALAYHRDKERVRNLDAAVKVDDTGAIMALRKLEDQWSTLHKISEQRVVNILAQTKNATQITYAGIGIIVVVSVMLLFWVFRLQQSVYRLVEQLHEARDRAEQASQHKSEFLASMSHELRTPLNAVLGYGQLLAMEKGADLTPVQREQVDHVLEGGGHLLELINEILDLAKIEANRLTINVETVDAMDVMEACVVQLEPLCRDQGIEIRSAFSGHTPIAVSTDALRFKQIVINLLSNAIKYNKPGGSVRVHGAKTDDGFLRISVADTGVGIPVEDQPHVFQLFQRAERNPYLATEGTGIGLTVTKMLLDKLAGAIGFESELGKGSVFWIEVPLASNDDVLIWTDELRCGIDPIDQDHQTIAMLYNRMLHASATEKNIREALEELIDYTHYHFRREEIVMQLCGYPGLAAHEQLHKNLLAKVNAFADSMVTEDMSGLRAKLSDILRTWLKQHIISVDSDIAAYAAGKEIEIRKSLRILG